jgi:HAD superfamily hydrolase (TIGR01509 family)
MNKLVIFDLDGVLVDSKDIHFHALNRAIRFVDSKYTIRYEEHLNFYDGLPTLEKLKLLSKEKKLPNNFHNKIFDLKQEETSRMFDELSVDNELIKHCQLLKDNNIKIAVASNSIKSTLIKVLDKLGIINYMDYYVSNEDVLRKKPHPEMYWKCMTELDSIPQHTVIFEDSPIGIRAALDSKSNLIKIENRSCLTRNKIKEAITMLKNQSTSTAKWKDEKLNVLIPMAGAGSRFIEAGYTFPKPLIEVHGKPMIQVVVDNIGLDANYHFVVQKEHREKYNLDTMLNLIAPNCTVIEVDGLTEGAACTALLAKEFINNDNPLFFANSDQWVDWNPTQFMYHMQETDADGGILTFNATHPKWSYAKTDDDGIVIEVAEKNPISTNATVGYYYWKHGSDFVKYAEEMINKNIRVNNEFYVCPVYNQAIKDGKSVRISEAKEMWGLGTPEDLKYFLENFG